MAPASITPKGVTLFEFCGDLWHKKTRVPVILCLAVLTQYWHVTDGQTHNDSIYCGTSIALCGKNSVLQQVVFAC